MTEFNLVGAYEAAHKAQCISPYAYRVYWSAVAAGYLKDACDVIVKQNAERKLTGHGDGGCFRPGDKERSWQITEERIATISASLKVLERLKKVNTDTDHCYLDAGIAVLRAMLKEVEG